MTEDQDAELIAYPEVPEDQDTEGSAHPEVPEGQYKEASVHPEVPEDQDAEGIVHPKVTFVGARYDKNTQKTPDYFRKVDINVKILINMIRIHGETSTRKFML